VREVTDRQKDRHTDTGDFIICSMLYYSSWTDNKSNEEGGASLDVCPRVPDYPRYATASVLIVAFVNLIFKKLMEMNTVDAD